MPADYTYDYAIIRVVPRVDRGEQVNAGVILSCVDAEFLDAAQRDRLLSGNALRFLGRTR